MKTKPIERILSWSTRFGPGLAVVALAGGCGTGTEPPVPAAITISPESATLVLVGETIQLVATVQDPDGEIISDAPVTWTSGDGSVVTVDANGLVTAVGKGDAPVRAAVGDVVEARSTVTVDLERGVLLKVYEQLDGPDWDYNRNWGTDAPVGSWWGVTVDSAGNVSGLVLYHNELTGSIPPEIGSLTELETLALGDNELTGPIPPELGNLTKLVFLVLYDNELTGLIPSELGNLARLEHLSLAVNELTGPIPSELGNLARLEHLSLAVNELTGPIPSELGNLARLEHLSLAGNELTGPIPPELGNLQSLLALWLGGNDLTGLIPPELGNLRGLASLSLAGNELTGPIPPELGDMSNLQYLTLSGTELTGPVPPEFVNLRILRSLRIDNTALSGRLPRGLMGIIRLQQFYWYETGLCSPRDEEFQEWLASIRGRRGNGKCAS